MLTIGALTGAAGGWIDSEEDYSDLLLGQLGPILGYTSGRIWRKVDGDAPLSAGPAWIEAPEDGEHLPDVLARLPRGPIEGDLVQQATRQDGRRPAPTCRGGTIAGIVTLFAEDSFAPSRQVLDGLKVVALALGTKLSPPEARQLSPRELDVLRLASYGLTNLEIAGRLSVSVATVKTHLVHVFAKLATPDRAAAVGTALRQGLIV